MVSRAIRSVGKSDGTEAVGNVIWFTGSPGMSLDSGGASQARVPIERLLQVATHHQFRHNEIVAEEPSRAINVAADPFRKTSNYLICIVDLSVNNDMSQLPGASNKHRNATTAIKTKQTKRSNGKHAVVVAHRKT